MALKEGIAAGGHFEFTPDYAVPPGWTLLDLLEERGMTQAELAQRTDLSVKHINRLVKGHVPLSTDVALRLERVTGVSVRFWLTRESIYQERRARLAEERNLEKDSALLDELPIEADSAGAEDHVQPAPSAVSQGSDCFVL